MHKKPQALLSIGLWGSYLTVNAFGRPALVIDLL